MQSKLFSEMVLIDADQNRAEGEALDISHVMAFASPMKIYAGTYDDVSDAAIIVITAGANQKPEETRLDLIQKNAKIMRSIIGEIKKRDFEGILLIVSNPVDILTHIALKESGYPANRVIGSGTVLDTGRFRYELGEHLGVDSRSAVSYTHLKPAHDNLCRQLVSGRWQRYGKRRQFRTDGNAGQRLCRCLLYTSSVWKKLQRRWNELCR